MSRDFKNGLQSQGKEVLTTAQHLAQDALDGTADLSSYPLGTSVMYVTSSASGWPTGNNYNVVTHRVFSSQSLQLATATTTDATLWWRRWNNASSAWGAWQGTPIGNMPFALPIGGGTDQATTTARNLAASGGAMAVPFVLDAPMMLRSLSFWNTDAATARGPAEFALYYDRFNNANAIALVAGAVGTLSSWTPSAASIRTIDVTSPPVLLNPGQYWVLLKNNNAAAQTLGVGSTGIGTMAASSVQTKTLGTGAFGNTLDMVAATWTKAGYIPGVRLNGQVFGQSTSY